LKRVNASTVKITLKKACRRRASAEDRVRNFRRRPADVGELPCIVDG
jgi:hypothetical protein